MLYFSGMALMIDSVEDLQIETSVSSDDWRHLSAPAVCLK